MIFFSCGFIIFIARSNIVRLKFVDKIINEFSGYRKSRGVYKIKYQNVTINADVNGSYNILRKAIPNAFADGIEGVAVNPIRVKV